MGEFTDTKLGSDWYNRVAVGQPNDFLIVVTASSKTGVSGTGKTTLQTRLAKQTDLSDGGFDAEAKASLDAGTIAYERLPEIPNKSAVVWDEAQGAPGTTGLDARRAMKQESIDSLSSILANRDKQLTIIIGAQIFSMLDPRLYPLVDAWLLIRRGVDEPNGPLGTYHKVYVEDYELSSPDIKTPAIADFSWDALPADDPDYQHLEYLKQQAKTRNTGDDEEDGELAPDVQAEIAQAYREAGWSLRDIEEDCDKVTRSHEWIRNNTEVDNAT